MTGDHSGCCSPVTQVLFQQPSVRRLGPYVSALVNGMRASFLPLGMADLVGGGQGLSPISVSVSSASVVVFASSGKVDRGPLRRPRAMLAAANIWEELETVLRFD
jgi:hypothetical protein